MPRARVKLFGVPHWKGANGKTEGGLIKMNSMHANLKGPVASWLIPNSEVFKPIVICFVLAAPNILCTLVWLG
jgi:hypothetical protein